MIKNELGSRFGRLVVVARAANKRDGSARWECRCDCGNSTIQSGATLRSGVVVSCGCYNRDIMTTHNRTGSPEYKSWQAMKDRCCNPSSKDYPRYGGSGVTVCSRWLSSFENFFSDMGRRQKHQSLDRIDNNGNYEPGNCRWASGVTQSNNRRSSRLIDYNGETISISELARRIGITSQALTKRLRKYGHCPKAFSGRMDTRGNVID